MDTNEYVIEAFKTILVSDGKLMTGDSTIDFSGDVTDISRLPPELQHRYQSILNTLQRTHQKAYSDGYARGRFDQMGGNF